ncbi:MAG: thiamine-phosphate kinase [Betaproteobacteria bacterium]|nr:thiamine-phosphate kinase [Betaproteobacteria bacterium]
MAHPAEFELISRYFSRPTADAILGAGDDAALLSPSIGMMLAVATDTLVAGVHFFPCAEPFALGWKTLAVNLSDLAAMGASPRWALLSLTLPETDDVWLSAFAAGFYACAEKFSVSLVGGDTTRGSLAFSVTALGEVPAGYALCRHAAQAGDDVWVSGYPGYAALALKEIEGKITLPDSLRVLCQKHLHMPEPRVDLGISLTHLAHAVIDISDGLLNDLAHIARRSALEAKVFRHCLPRLPEGVARETALAAVLSGGDDYELLFTASPEHRPKLAKLGIELDLPLWRIGEMTLPEPNREPAARLFDPNGEEIAWTQGGYEHFKTL